MDTEYLPPCCKNAVEVAVDNERRQIVDKIKAMLDDLENHYYKYMFDVDRRTCKKIIEIIEKESK